MVAFRQIQHAFILLFILALGILFLSYLFIYQAGTNPIPLFAFILITILFAVVLLLFYRLKVVVFNDKILITFGVGLIWKIVDISRIKRIEIVRNPFYYGWGLRIIPNGMLYNISGFKAVELHFHDTGRILRIGSANPAKLKQEIETRMRERIE
jgi:hypothetical protein